MARVRETMGEAIDMSMMTMTLRTNSGRKRTLQLTAPRKRIIFGFRRQWLSENAEPGPSNGRSLNLLLRPKWEEDLANHLMVWDPAIGKEDVARWIKKHSWITHADEIPKGINVEVLNFINTGNETGETRTENKPASSNSPSNPSSPSDPASPQVSPLCLSLSDPSSPQVSPHSWSPSRSAIPKVSPPSSSPSDSASSQVSPLCLSSSDPASPQVSPLCLSSSDPASPQVSPLCLSLSDPAAPQVSPPSSSPSSLFKQGSFGSGSTQFSTSIPPILTPIRSPQHLPDYNVPGSSNGAVLTVPKKRLHLRETRSPEDNDMRTPLSNANTSSSPGIQVDDHEQCTSHKNGFQRPQNDIISAFREAMMSNAAQVQGFLLQSNTSSLWKGLMETNGAQGFLQSNTGSPMKGPMETNGAKVQEFPYRYTGSPWKGPMQRNGAKVQEFPYRYTGPPRKGPFHGPPRPPQTYVGGSQLRGPMQSNGAQVQGFPQNDTGARIPGDSEGSRWVPGYNSQNWSTGNGISHQSSTPTDSTPANGQPSSSHSRSPKRNQNPKTSSSIRDLKELMERIKENGFTSKKPWQVSDLKNYSNLDPLQASVRVNYILNGMQKIVNEYGKGFLDDPRLEFLIVECGRIYNRIMRKQMLPVSYEVAHRAQLKEIKKEIGTYEYSSQVDDDTDDGDFVGHRSNPPVITIDDDSHINHGSDPPIITLDDDDETIIVNTSVKEKLCSNNAHLNND